MKILLEEGFIWVERIDDIHGLAQGGHFTSSLCPFPSVRAYAPISLWMRFAVGRQCQEELQIGRAIHRDLPPLQSQGLARGKRGMTKLALLAAISGAFALAFIAGNVAATPLSEGVKSTLVAADAMSLIQPVHGCHRSCRFGWVSRWGVSRFHRHVGPHCRPVRC